MKYNFILSFIEMVSYYKYYDAVIEKFEWFGKNAESKWWDWRNNILELFKNAKRYHFNCKLWDHDSIFFNYYASKNEGNLVSFTLWKENWKFKCNSAFWFPYQYSEDKRNDVMYDICRDCLDDLESLEKSLES